MTLTVIIRLRKRASSPYCSGNSLPRAVSVPFRMVNRLLKLSIIVPAFNEEKTIIPVLEKIQASRPEETELEVIVVDDGSTDRTKPLLRENSRLYSQLVDMPRNAGKGVAVKEGLRAATGEFVLIQDADLEYDPGEYPVMVAPLSLDNADMVIGSRVVAPPITRVYYFWHKVGNSIITLLFNVLFNVTFTDIYSGFLIFRRTLVDPEKLKIAGWGQHAEILCTVVPSARGIYEVPVSYFGRTYDEGKKIRAHHVIFVIYAIISGRARQLFR